LQKKTPDRQAGQGFDYTMFGAKACCLAQAPP